MNSNSPPTDNDESDFSNIQPPTSSFLDPNLQQRVIPEESSKENSSDSSSLSTYKDKLVKEIQNHTLGEILKARMKEETFKLFYFKYSVQTFE